MEDTNQTLTQKQIALLDYLRHYIALKQYAPLYEEICEGLGWSTKSLVDYHLGILERKGYITRQAHQPRTIVLTEEISTAHAA